MLFRLKASMVSKHIEVICDHGTCYMVDWCYVLMFWNITIAILKMKCITIEVIESDYNIEIIL